jgi:hypothetical protein
MPNFRLKGEYHAVLSFAAKGFRLTEKELFYGLIAMPYKATDKADDNTPLNPQRGVF